MSAANTITPFLVQADAQRPDLKQTNTAMSCFELLKLALALAGPEWAFIGKTRTMDGASVTPPGFQAFDQELTRNDGARQRVQIVGVSMDSAWHVPTNRQVKVIANSSANDDPNPAIHGPAKLTPYDIDPQYYRWHNPPVPQSLVGGAAPLPQPVPVPPSVPAAQLQIDDLAAQVANLAIRVGALADAVNARAGESADVLAHVKDVRAALQNGLAIDATVRLPYLGASKLSGVVKG